MSVQTGWAIATSYFSINQQAWIPEFSGKFSLIPMVVFRDWLREQLAEGNLYGQREACLYLVEVETESYDLARREIYGDPIETLVSIRLEVIIQHLRDFLEAQVKEMLPFWQLPAHEGYTESNVVRHAPAIVAALDYLWSERGYGPELEFFRDLIVEECKHRDSRGYLEQHLPEDAPLLYSDTKCVEAPIERHVERAIWAIAREVEATDRPLVRHVLGAIWNIPYGYQEEAGYPASYYDWSGGNDIYYSPSDIRDGTTGAIKQSVREERSAKELRLHDALADRLEGILRGARIHLTPEAVGRLRYYTHRELIVLSDKGKDDDESFVQGGIAQSDPQLEAELDADEAWLIWNDEQRASKPPKPRRRGRKGEQH